ncbi:MAG TPA: oligosaccharide flippase family protein, partial [Bryobacterales bacterium]|nr:oligosaccharide flippase family protein [Bryobacterales bacterium]
MSEAPRRTFVNDVFWNAAMMAIALPASVATSVLIGRILGPAGKGEYALAVLVGILLVTVLNLGIPASISYFVGGGETPQRSLIKTVVILAGILAAAALAIAGLLDRTGWCSYIFGIPRFTRTVWIVVLGLPFQFWGTFLQYVILAQGDRVLFAALPVFGQLIVTVLVVAFALTGVLAPATAACAAVASQIFGAAFLLIYVQRRVDWLRAPVLPSAFWKRLAKYSLTSYVAGTLQFLIQRIDVLLVSVLLGLRAVGLYSVAYGVAELLMLLPQRINSLYLPRIAGERAPHGKAEEVRLSSSLVFVGTVGAAAALALAAPFAIRFFYGRAYGPSVSPFLLLLPGICGMAASSIQSAYLSGVGMVHINAAVAAAGLALNVALNLLLIPRYGISGAAVASSLTYWAQAIALIAAVSRLTHARPLAMLTSAPP